MASDIKNGQVNLKNCKFISKEQALSLDKGFAKNGDILITHKATIGETAILKHLKTEFAILTPQITYYRIIDKDKLSMEYLITAFNSCTFQNRIKRWASQSTRPYIGIEEQHNLLIPYTTYNEQIKIGSIFKVLQQTISIQERKLKQLKLLKKGLLQKMFADENSKVPEIRFDNFTSKWKNEKLGEIFTTVTDYVANGSFKALRENVSSYTTENYAYMVRLQDASNNWNGPWLYTDKKGYNYLKKSSLQYHDIIMANVGSVGKFFLIPKLDRPSTLAPNSVLLRSKKHSNDFLYQLLRTKNIQNSVKRKTTPGVQNKINKTDFKKINAVVPDANEEKKISSMLSIYDDKIRQENKKLSQLKQVKKFLLQNMFI